MHRTSQAPAEVLPEGPLSILDVGGAGANALRLTEQRHIVRLTEPVALASHLLAVGTRP